MNIVFKFYTLMFVLTVLTTSILSVIVTILNVFLYGKDLNDGYIFVIAADMPFVVDSWYKYSFGFIWTSGCFAMLGTSKGLVPMFIFAVCFYSIADLKNALHLAQNIGSSRYLNIISASVGLNQCRIFQSR